MNHMTLYALLWMLLLILLAAYLNELYTALSKGIS